MSDAADCCPVPRVSIVTLEDVCDPLSTDRATPDVSVVGRSVDATQHQFAELNAVESVNPTLPCATSLIDEML